MKDSFKFHVNYEKALVISQSKHYSQVHKTAFKDSQFLKLIFKDGVYYWTISQIKEDKWEGYLNGNSGTITSSGKTLFIDCSTGETTECDFGGLINVCD